VGSGSAAACVRAAARPTARSPELGRYAGAAGSDLGCAPARCAGPATSCRATASSACRTAAAGAFRPGTDMGFTPGRVSAATGIRSRRLGPSGTVMGRSAAGRIACRPRRDRLGNTPRKPSRRGSAGAVVERAGSSVVVGRSENGRACRPAGAVVGCAFSFFGCTGRMVAARPAGCAASSCSVGSSGCRARAAGRS
jgi:hypothetical protein